MIRYIGLYLVALLLLVGCTEDEDILTPQKTAIERYLTSSRHMVNETELDDVIADQPPFYTVFGRYTYRHIPTFYNAERESQPVIEVGDLVEMYFDAYVFQNSEPSIADLYWSNIEATIEKATSAMEYATPSLQWSREPLVVRLGSTPMLEGLTCSLAGCREQDSVQVYMTSNMAYGKNWVGTLSKNSSVAWYIKIQKVTK